MRRGRRAALGIGPFGWGLVATLVAGALAWAPVAAGAPLPPPSLRVAVAPSPVPLGAPAEILVQFAPARLLRSPHLTTVVQEPGGRRQEVALAPVPGQRGLWEGTAPAGRTGRYVVSVRLASKAGGSVWTASRPYTVVPSSPLARSSRILAFVVVALLVWFMSRRRYRV
jgi:hypothetical protein